MALALWELPAQAAPQLHDRLYELCRACSTAVRELSASAEDRGLLLWLNQHPPKSPVPTWSSIRSLGKVICFHFEAHCRHYQDDKPLPDVTAFARSPWDLH